MQSLLSFIYKKRVIIVFLFLEIFSLWLIFSKNPYQSTAFFTSSNYMVGKSYEVKNNVLQYFDLVEKNNILQEENAKLMKTLQSQIFVNNRNIDNKQKGAVGQLEDDSLADDSLAIKQYDFLPAVVLQNSVAKANNYFVLNRGRKNGVEAGMGVYDQRGAVGVVKSASSNFSSVYSLLHQNLVVSALHKKSGELCSVQWENNNINKTRLLYLPKHVNVFLGDTIVTSGYANAFVKGIPIGIISDVKTYPNEAFYDIEISFTSNFNALNRVYIIKKNYRKVTSELLKE